MRLKPTFLIRNTLLQFPEAIRKIETVYLFDIDNQSLIAFYMLLMLRIYRPSEWYAFEPPINEKKKPVKQTQ